MSRKILWKSGKLDKVLMEKAYSRIVSETDMEIVEFMEGMALKESKENCVIMPGAYLCVKRREEKMYVRPDTYDLLNDGEKEGVICFLGKVAMVKAKKVSELEYHINAVQVTLKCPACFAFLLMSELEKLQDKVKHFTVKIYVPEKGELLNIYMGLLKNMYPWADIVIEIVKKING